MRLRAFLMLALSLPALCAAAPAIGVFTIVEGEAMVIRDTVRFAVAEGLQFQPDDIVHTADNAQFVRMEFAQGGVVDLGPGTRVLLKPRFTPPADRPAQAYMLQGWAKITAAAAQKMNFSSARIDVTELAGVGVARVSDDLSFLFVESGSAKVAERGAQPRVHAVAGGEAYERRASDSGAVVSRPAADIVKAMPRAFADTLPLRAKRFQDSPVAPASAVEIVYEDVAMWINAERALRPAFVQRWNAKAKRTALSQRVDRRVAHPPRVGPRTVSREIHAQTQTAGGGSGERPNPAAGSIRRRRPLRWIRTAIRCGRGKCAGLDRPGVVVMKLLLKFNLAFIAVFLIGLALTGFVSRELLVRNAQEEVLQHARFMMEKALAVRAYTSTQVAPLLETQMKYSFLPQSVPAFSATEVLARLQKAYPDYSYKEATLNPTNPRDRAVEWEVDVISAFRKSADAQEFVGERDTPSGRSLYIARPIKITNEACLRCHSTVDAAPKTLVEKYGPANGFGWNLNEIVGAQMVSVPMAVPMQRADRAFSVFMALLTAVFVAIGLLLNVMLWWLVIRPVTKLSAIADRVSLGDLQAPSFEAKSSDEIGVLAQSFTRMRKSLVQAMKMLES